jgi:protein subunit release factor B
MKTKQLLFSVTEKDCIFTTTRGSGPGGQHRNKTETAVYCKHKESGAVGYACDGKSQRQNKEAAFKRMAESKEFKIWHKVKVSELTGETIKIEEKVNRLMNESYIRTEVKNDKGLWEQIDPNTIKEENNE